MGAGQDWDEGGVDMAEVNLMRGVGYANQTSSPYANKAESQSMQNLYEMLFNKGRVDPRLLASLQASNARSTQSQQTAARGNAAASGMSGSGLSAAIQAAIGSAGANRSANLNYQDIADSYGRNQQNMGLMNQIIQQPGLGYASLAQNQSQFDKAQANQSKAAKYALIGSLFGAAGTAAGGYGGGGG
jgi:hypothetical protein